jgi:hypothetical protein
LTIIISRFLLIWFTFISFIAGSTLAAKYQQKASFIIFSKDFIRISLLLDASVLTFNTKNSYILGFAKSSSVQNSCKMPPKRKAPTAPATPNKKKSSTSRALPSSEPYKTPFEPVHRHPRKDLPEDDPGDDLEDPEDPEESSDVEDLNSSDPEPPSSPPKQCSQSNHTNDPSHHPDTNSSEGSGTPKISSSEIEEQEEQNDPNTKCQGTLRNKKPCSRYVGPKGLDGYCWQHRGQAGAAARKPKKKVKKSKKVAEKKPARKSKKKGPSLDTETSSSNDRPAPMSSEPKNTETEEEEVIKRSTKRKPIRKVAEAKKDKSPSPEIKSEGDSRSEDEDSELSDLTSSESDSEIEAPVPVPISDESEDEEAAEGEEIPFESGISDI